MGIRLAICKHGGPHRVVEMHCNPYRIGRSDECDLQLNSRSVSRSHCELKMKQVGLTIKDLGSRNGTIINGVVAPVGVRLLLRKDDQVKIGKYELCVTDEVGAVSKLPAERPENSSSELSTQVGSELLEMLEQFIAENRDSTTITAGEFRAGKKPDTEKKGDPWTVLREPAVHANEEHGTGQNALPTDESASVEATTHVDTVDAVPSQDTQVDAAEARRLDLRDRLEGLKAKDSREAADRALKNLFRR
jgi:pSer/pThr/pTyr-binding forkhead associated (FHA) protein